MPNKSVLASKSRDQNVRLHEDGECELNMDVLDIVDPRELSICYNHASGGVVWWRKDEEGGLRDCREYGGGFSPYLQGWYKDCSTS